MRNVILSLITLFGVLALLVPGALGLENRYVEDFSTTSYRDPFNTTAIWDTGAGELRTPPFTLRPVASADTPDDAWDVFAAGLRAYVADGSSLQIFDISTPMMPWLLGSLGLAPGARDVVVAGNWAFVANSAAGLQVIDVSNPAAPLLAANVAVAGVARSVFLSGRLAFVAADAAGLQIFDVSAPWAPALLGAYDTPGSAWGVFVDGTRAYVADREGGLQIVDVSNPSLPAFLSDYSTGGLVHSVFVAGGVAFVADVTNGLYVLDVSGTQATLLGQRAGQGAAVSACAVGDRVFLADGTSLLVFDVGDPAAPSLAASWQAPGIVQGVCLWGHLALVANGTEGLHLLAISEPTPPAMAGTYQGVNTSYDVAVSGSLALLATYNGPMIFDISDPGSPQPLGFHPLNGAISVAVSGSHAFVGSMYGEMHVLDIGDPTAPMLVGMHQVPPNPIRSIQVQGDRAYLLGGAGLSVLDVSVPSLPAPLGFLALPAPNELVLAGDRAYVADAVLGLQIVDIGDPYAPAPLGRVDLPGAVAVAVSGNLAFVLNGPILFVVDVTDAAAPYIAGTSSTPEPSACLTVHGNRAYLGDGSNLYVVEVSNSGSLLVGSLTIPNVSVIDLCVTGDFVALAAGGGGFHLVRVAQHVADGAFNRAQSSTIKGDGHLVSRARLSATQTEGVGWYLSTDGWNWEAASPGTSWAQLSPGSWLMWRAILFGAGVIPTVHDLQVEWLYEFPLVATVSDIPRDQGRQVRVEWLRSDHDFLGNPQQIVEYALYRKVDPGLGKRATGPAKAAGLSEAALLHAQAMAEEGWDFLQTVPVRVQDRYSVVVPTLEDSTSGGAYWSVFMVSALTATPGLFFDSPADSGQSVDNLAPSVPTGFAVAYGYGTTGNALSWEESPEADFRYFRIYRGTDPAFVPSEADLVHQTTGVAWVDPQPGGSGLHYRVSAVDFAGNESPAAAPQSLTGVGDPSLPASFALRRNVPNPFNPTTLIRYDVPAGGGPVSLRIYDLGGRLVRSLVEGRQEAGTRAAVWDGRDESGKTMASGTYLCRLTAPGTTQTQKMTLTK